MPAAAMAMRRKIMCTIMPGMITHRTITATIIITTMTITTMIITTTSIAITRIITAIPMLMTTNKPPAKPRRRRIEQVDARSEVAAPPINDAEAAALYRLMTWLSPAFPVGAFSYSSGIEWAVEAGDIHDAASLRDWLAAMLEDGPGFCDGVFLAHTHRAVSLRDADALREVTELAAAFVPSRERQLETTAQGRAFIDIAVAAWNCDGLDAMIALCGGPMVYPVAVGLVSSMHAIPLSPTLHAFFHALASNWISAGARLVPLGQTDSQRLLVALEPIVVATARRARDAALDDLGSATFRADLASMRHETQYTRLFRS
jgi:urease accessory protein